MIYNSLGFSLLADAILSWLLCVPREVQGSKSQYGWTQPSGAVEDTRYACTQPPAEDHKIIKFRYIDVVKGSRAQRLHLASKHEHNYLLKGGAGEFL